MSRMKTISVAIATAGSLLIGVVASTPLMATPTNGHQRFGQAAPTRIASPTDQSDRVADQSGMRTRQCENVETYYAQVKARDPGLVPGDASSYAGNYGDMQRAGASSPICR